MLKFNIPKDTRVQMFSHPGGQQFEEQIQNWYETDQNEVFAI